MSLLNRMGLLYLLVCFLMGCDHDSRRPKAALYQVQLQPHVTSLSWSGTIKPLQTTVIASPVDGAIVDMRCQYGEPVKQGQVLFTLSSTHFISDYKNALTQYLKAKSDVSLAATQLAESKFLHQHQLISDDEFHMKQSSYYASRLSFLQAKDALQDLMQNMPMQQTNLDQMTIADAAKINEAMHLQAAVQTLAVRAPVDGVMLAPGKNEEEAHKLQKGDAVKQGDVLALVGDVSGLRLGVTVSELEINKLRVGQGVTVTGVAFPDDRLLGRIARIDKQGIPSSSGMPGFAVDVVVPALTQAQQQHIFAGMTARVDLNTEAKQDVMIPLRAVHEKNGVAWVEWQHPVSHKIIKREIQAGMTTADAVVVQSGLKPGDTIVLPHPA